MDNDQSMVVAGLAQRVVGQIEQASGLKAELLEKQVHATRMDDSGAAKRRLRQEQEENRKLRETLEIKEALLKEWMHSNEAFKRLARKYGKKVGVSDEQRQNDLDDQILEVAEEKPEFAATDTLARAKARSASKQ